MSLVSTLLTGYHRGLLYPDVREDSRVNKVESFTEILRARIRDNEFGIAGRIPAIRDLEREYEGYGRNTIIEAIGRLRAEGLLVEKGRSSYVVPRRVVRIMTTDLPSLAESLESIGLVPQTRNSILGMSELPEEVAQMFGLTAGQRCLYRRDVQGTVRVPYRFYDMWYVHPLAGSFLRRIQDDPSFFIMRELSAQLGYDKQCITEDVCARLPTAEEADILSISRSSPILGVKRVNATPDGAIMLVQIHRFVASLVEFRYQFTR